MKAKLTYDEENKRVMAHLEECPRPDGTSASISWIVIGEGKQIDPFTEVTEEMMRQMDGQEIEVEDAEKLWSLHTDKIVSMGYSGLPVEPKLRSLLKIRQCIGLLNSMIECGDKHSDVSREAVREAFWILDEEMK